MWSNKFLGGRLEKLLICLISLIIATDPVSGTITVVFKVFNDSVTTFEDVPARFISENQLAYGVQGFLVYSNPANACGSSIHPPPDSIYPGMKVNWILLAARYGCDFEEKILNAQSAGYAGIIVHNVDSNDTEAMGANNPSKIIIYSCFVGEFTGQQLRDEYAYHPSSAKSKEPPEYWIRIQDGTFSPAGYLLPFAIVVAVCFVVMIIFMVRLLWQQVVSCIRERNRVRRRILSSSALKKLPITKWTKGDPYETCAICLEDFVEHDKVRVLPCSHGFHSVCIDPWLTKGRRVCPICKRKVVLLEERLPAPTSDTDTDDETAPLLGSAGASTSGAAAAALAPNPVTSTSAASFVQRQRQHRNPFRRAGRRNRATNVAAAAAAVDDSSDADTTSTTSSGSSQGQGHREAIMSHRSLPVYAQVHHPSEENAMSRALSSSSTAITMDVGTTEGAEIDMSQSQFYISCEQVPEAEDEEMLVAGAAAADAEDEDEEMLDTSPTEVVVVAPEGSRSRSGQSHNTNTNTNTTV